GKLDITMTLGDIDADGGRGNEGLSIHDRSPILPMRARCSLGGRSALAAVRIDWTRSAAIRLRDGVIGARTQSICRRPLRNSFLATARNELRSGLYHIGNSCLL